MEKDNPVVRLCWQGSRAEYEGQLEQARAFYRKAWDLAESAYEACIAAHYMARIQEDPQKALHWNEIALERAEFVDDTCIMSFYPSLYVNLGRSHELLGNKKKAQDFYTRASKMGLDHENLDTGGLRNPSKG